MNFHQMAQGNRFEMFIYFIMILLNYTYSKINKIDAFSIFAFI